VACRAGQPGPRRCRRPIAAPLELEGHEPAAGRLVQAIVIVGEAARQPELAVEHERADECRRVVAAGGQRLGHRRDIRRQHEVAVVAHAMAERLEAGQEAGMGWQGERHWRQRAFESNAVASQPVEVVGRSAGIAVAAQPIGPRRVERDQQDVRRLRRGQRPQGDALAGSSDEDGECGRGDQCDNDSKGERAAGATHRPTLDHERRWLARWLAW
jgi:hypothetical protein